MTTARELERSRSDSVEVARLKRELEETRARLEEEVGYYRAELESTRQRIEKEHVRVQSDEVMKRRRVEEQVLALKADLRVAQQEAEQARERYEALAQQLAAQEESSRRHTQQEVDKVRAAARAAWKNAEDELSQTENEMNALREQVAAERERNRQMEASINRLRAEKTSTQRMDADSLKVVSSLKKALFATAQARRRAEMELAKLRADGPKPQAGPVQAVYQAYQQQSAAPATPAATSAPDPKAPRWQSGEYNELNGDHLKNLVVGSGNDEFSDEFLLMPSDASLDQETFEALQEIPDPEPGMIAAPVVHEVAKQAVSAAHRPEAPAAKRAEPEEKIRIVIPPDPDEGSRSGVAKKAGLVAGGAVGAAALYWILEKFVL